MPTAPPIGPSNNNGQGPNIPPANPNGPLGPTSGIAGLIGGQTSPTGSAVKQCGYTVNVPLPGGLSYKEFVAVVPVSPNARCPGNLHEDDTRGQSGLANVGSHLRQIGLLLAGAVLLIVGVWVFLHSSSGDRVVSTVTGT